MRSKLCEIQTMTDLGIESARLFKLSFGVNSSIIFIIETYRFSFNFQLFYYESYFNSNCKVFNKEIRPPNKSIHIQWPVGVTDCNLIPSSFQAWHFSFFEIKSEKSIDNHGPRTPNEAFFSLKSRTFGIGHTNLADKFWGIRGISAKRF